MDIASKDAARILLQNTATSYDIRVRRDEIEMALEDPIQGPALVEWASSHLLSDNLLTADELALYSALDSSGQVDKLSELQDLAEVQPIRHDDLKAAIAELRRSTDSINEQTETLRHQHDALSRLAAKCDEDGARRRQLDLAHERTSEVEQTRLASHVDQLSQAIQQQLSQLTNSEQPGKSDFRGSLEDAFQSDDRLLASLQKLGWELEQPDPEEAVPVEKLKEVCMRLIKITVQSVRTRLDTTYLNTLIAAHQTGASQPASEAEMAALQDEVESLYAEILPVAQMAVEQQHLEPALLAVSSKNGQSQQKTMSSLTYMNQCLDYLLGRVNRLQSRMYIYKSHMQAVQTVVATAKTETTSTEATNNTRRPPISALNRRQDAKSRRRSSGYQDIPPLDSLMQSLSLPVEAFEAPTPTDKARILAKALSERREKNKDVSAAAQDALEQVISSQIDDARRAVQLLRDSIAAESSFGSVQLMDPDLDQSLVAMKREAANLNQQLAEMDMSIEESGRSDKKEELIERWSR